VKKKFTTVLACHFIRAYYVGGNGGKLPQSRASGDGGISPSDRERSSRTSFTLRITRTYTGTNTRTGVNVNVAWDRQADGRTDGQTAVSCQ